MYAAGRCRLHVGWWALKESLALELSSTSQRNNPHRCHSTTATAVTYRCRARVGTFEGTAHGTVPLGGVPRRAECLPPVESVWALCCQVQGLAGRSFSVWFLSGWLFLCLTCSHGLLWCLAHTHKSTHFSSPEDASPC
ncbi:MAG: hypothetical protein J3K34DRAFT_408871 [Monoraphidium minutum]|nr:MAG: hypothetical protein J3K34DRAFT_408871 [Monoraphidium minutum]